MGGAAEVEQRLHKRVQIDESPGQIEVSHNYADVQRRLIITKRAAEKERRAIRKYYKFYECIYNSDIARCGTSLFSTVVVVSFAGSPFNRTNPSLSFSSIEPGFLFYHSCVFPNRRVNTNVFTIRNREVSSFLFPLYMSVKFITRPVRDRFTRRII